MIFDPTPLALGEGPLWHPKREALFRFDILGNRLIEDGRDWRFDRHVSAAGWLDETSLIVASETDLCRLDLTTGAQERLVPLEADQPATRSNDGRADPWGGFWIGTMGKATEPGLGAIYRYYRGELRRLYERITVSNAICFSPNGLYAYFTDTPTGQVLRQPLAERDGWPKGAPEVWLDLTAEGLAPDGAVIDAAGQFWNAQWGAGRVAVYDADGVFVAAHGFDAVQTTCPAFGGPDLTDLYCTSAAVGLNPAGPSDGATFVIPGAGRGQAEHQVIL